MGAIPQKTRILYDNLWDLGAITCSSEDPNFPAANTKLSRYTQAWRATGAASEWLLCTLPTAYTVDSFFCRGSNLTAYATVTLDGYLGANHVLSFGIDPSAGIMAAWCDPTTIDSLMLTFADAANPLGYVSVGRPAFGAMFSPQRNHEHLDLSPQDLSTVARNIDGQKFSVLRGYYWRHGYRFPMSHDYAAWWAFWNAVRNSKPFFFCEDSHGAPDNTYYCTLGNFAPKPILWNTWDIEFHIEEEP
jgi:hypothetical protein